MRYINLKKLKTYSIRRRKSKVKQDEFAKPLAKGASFRAFYDSLPGMLAAANLLAVVRDIVRARKKMRPVILMMGAHVIKCGLSPVIIDLMRRGVITGIATNGACIIHDFEIAYLGKTSEDVTEALADGSFGMARESAEYINGAIVDANNSGLGLG